MASSFKAPGVPPSTAKRLVPGKRILNGAGGDDSDGAASLNSGKLRSVSSHKTRITSVTGPARFQGSAAAGAVSEDYFHTAFNDVPKTEIYSGKELLSQMQSVRTVLDNTNSDWQKRVDALKKLRSIVNANAMKYDEFWNELRLLDTPLQAAVKDLRSQVVRECCVTIAHLAERLQMRSEVLMDSVFSALINQMQNSAKVMASSSYVCSVLVIKTVQSAKLVPILASHMTSKSKDLRRACCELMALVLSTWDSHTLEKQMLVICEAVKTGLTDPDAAARAASRDAYRQLYDNYPASADMLYSQLDGRTRKLIDGDGSASSSTVSINNAGAHRRSQENINKYALPQKMYYGARSTSDIDPSAARRAMQRNAHNRMNMKPPLQPMNSLPRSRLVSGSGLGSPGSVSQTQQGARGSIPGTRLVSTTSKLVTQTQRPSVRTPSKCNSQPGSRSNSPDRAPQYGRGSASARKAPNGGLSRIPGTPIRSGATSRESSPPGSLVRTPNAANTSSRRYSDVSNNKNTNQSLLNDAMKPNSMRYTLDDFEDNVDSVSAKDTRRQNTNRNSQESAALQTAMRQLSSPQWNDRKDGLKALQSLFYERHPLSNLEIKKLSDILARLFGDQNLNKMLSPLLDTLDEFVIGYRSQLCDWLFTLLTQLIRKQATEPIASVQAKVTRTLDRVKEQFPLELQFKALSKYLVDPLNQPSAKVKAALLHYLCGVLQTIDPVDFERCSQDRQYTALLKRLVELATDSDRTKTPEVKQQSANVLVALFAVNESEFMTRLDELTKVHKENACKVLHEQMSRNTHNTPTNNNTNARTNGSHGGRQLQPELDDVHGQLLETSAEIKQYVQAQASAKGSHDSGIVDALDTLPRAEDTARGMDAASVMADQENTIMNIMRDMAEYTNNQVRCEAMSNLKLITRDGSFTLWDEHFKTLLLMLIEALAEDEDSRVRRSALAAIREICQHQAPRFRDFAEFTLLKVLDVQNDTEREVLRAADDCCSVLATHLPPHVSLRTLNSVILEQQMPKLLPAIKMLNKVLEKLMADEVLAIMDDVVPGLIKSYDSEDSSVRKASVLCLVTIHNTVGQDKLEPYIAHMLPAKRKLIDLYIRRATSDSTSQMSGKGTF